MKIDGVSACSLTKACSSLQAIFVLWKAPITGGGLEAGCPCPVWAGCDAKGLPVPVECSLNHIRHIRLDSS